MPTREEILAELQKREQAPSFSREDIMAELQSREGGESMFGDIPSNLQARGEEISKITGGGYPGQSLASDVLQVGGQLAGGVGDVVGETASRFISNVTPDVVKDYASQAVQAGGDYLSGMYSPEEQAEIDKATADISGYYSGIAEAHPEMARNVEAAATIGVVTPPAAVATRGASAGIKQVKKAIDAGKPVSLNDLKVAERAAYDNAQNLAASTGAKIKADALNKKVTFNIDKALKKPSVGKLDPDVHPRSTQAVGKISERLATDTIDPIDIEHTRRLIDDYINASKDLGADTPDTFKLYHIKESFDDAVDSIDTKDFLGGSKEIVDNFKEARKISSVRHKVEPLQDIFDKAANAKKGSSYETVLKGGFVNLANNKRKMKKYNKKEQFLIRKAARTGAIEGITNKFGVFSPTSGKIGAVISSGLGAGALTANPALAAIPAAGYVSKSISDQIARSNAQRAMRDIAGQLKPSLAERARALVQQQEIK